jgi:nitrite reductase/ring-hydroxylating ferredoxin subunit
LCAAEQGFELPAEAVVILREGADYGWPQCYNDGQSQKLVLAPDGDKKVGLRCRRPRQSRQRSLNAAADDRRQGQKPCRIPVRPTAGGVIVRAEFQRAGTIQELRTKGRLIVRGAHRPILIIEDQGQLFALDNRCPHMGFPLDRGSVEDGILTCHWHHARFDLASGCTFDLWADDVPTCAVELRADEVWVQPEFGRSDAAAYWRQRLEQGMASAIARQPSARSLPPLPSERRPQC